uniref:WD repeat-containing protein on Y chromosome n=1 Tax=Sander lucioperca TaxID=283035 RepID=A0A8D0CS10_SANLU
RTHRYNFLCVKVNIFHDICSQIQYFPSLSSFAICGSSSKTMVLPLCCALYHNIFKQVVSVCQNGVVTVWDILTGTAVMQFKVTPDQHVGHIAISFDGLKRRLITISQDGKVKLWNFNSGTELAILPVIVQSEVTGIGVCVGLVRVIRFPQTIVWVYSG